MQDIVGPSAVGKANPSEEMPLHEVIAAVKAALEEYQNSIGSGPNALPPLSSADFEFKTTTAVTVGGSINLLIFKFGASREKDVVHDVTFSYDVPQPKSGPLKAPAEPPFQTALAETIRSAAEAVKTAGSLGNLSFSKLTLTVQYGVKWDTNAGGSGPISFVTVGLNADRNKNTVHSVKLVFAD